MGSGGDELGRRNVAIRHQTAPALADAAIARLGSRQWGIVDRRQLAELGIGPSGIARRVRAGRLHPLHRGVYAVGHLSLARRGRWLAAVLACGPGAVLSHRAAAALWDLGRERGGRIDVTTANRSGSRSLPGVVAHRVRALHPDETGEVDAIPCTSVARTLVDLAGIAPGRELERACERAEMLRLIDLRAIEEVLGRARGRRGGRALRSLLAGWSAGSTVTRSELEELFLAAIRAAGLPEPRLNAAVLVDGGRRHVEVDALWPAERLIVELDGHGVHGTRAAFERDRERDVALMLAGYRVARFTWLELTSRRHLVCRRVAALLASGR